MSNSNQVTVITPEILSLETQLTELQISHITRNVTGIFGVSGIGKTNTMWSIVETLTKQQNIPFTGFRLLDGYSPSLPEWADAASNAQIANAIIFYANQGYIFPNLPDSVASSFPLEANEGFDFLTASSTTLQEHASALAEFSVEKQISVFLEFSGECWYGANHKVGLYLRYYLTQLQRSLLEFSQQPYLVATDLIGAKANKATRELLLYRLDNLKVVYTSQSLATSSEVSEVLPYTDTLIIHRLSRGEQLFDLNLNNEVTRFKRGECLILDPKALTPLIAHYPVTELSQTVTEWQQIRSEVAAPVGFFNFEEEEGEN